MRIGLPSLLLMASALTTPALADPVADFYTGKRITLVVGYGTGGDYDQRARMIARYMGPHIPGDPTIIVQNMPGAGSRQAANWLYNVAPKDGTVMAALGQATPTDQALAQTGVQFDVRKFNWLGNSVVVNNTLTVWASTGVKSIEDARQRDLAIGGTGAASPSVLYPQVSNNLLGTKFRIITGYPGGGDVDIAMERGEVDGRGSNSWASWKSTKPDWMRDHRLVFLFQVGPKREPDLPDVPLWSELGRTPEQKQVLEVLSGDVAVGRPMLAPPDMPADRVQALRHAFDATMTDPAFVAEAKKIDMILNPISGEELQKMAAKIVSVSPTVVEMVKRAVEIKDVRELPDDKKPKGPTGGGGE